MNKKQKTKNIFIGENEKKLVRTILSASRLSNKWGLNIYSRANLITASVLSFLNNNNNNK